MVTLESNNSFELESGADIEMTTDYKEIFDRLSIYILAILISPILFGAFIATYTIVSVEDSWGFGPTFLVVILFSFLFFAFAALPVSLYIDFSARVKDYPNWLKALLYAGLGGLAGLLGSIVLFEIYSVFFMLFFGMIGGVIHFLILAVIKKVIK